MRLTRIFPPHIRGLLGIAVTTWAAPEPAEPAAGLSLAQAIEITLAQQPGVEIARLDVTAAEGQVQQAAGQFDWVVGGSFSDEVSRRPTGVLAPLPTEQREDIATLQLGAAKQLRNGVVVSPSVGILDTKDSLTTSGATSRSNLGVTVTVPLLRGFGAASTGAYERAAKIQLEAQQHLTRATLEQLVYTTTVAYWNCLAARQDRDILADSARRADDIFQFVNVLAEGGEIDAATQRQAQALLSARQGHAVEGELSYFQSRQNLAVALGYNPAQQAEAPAVNGTFPPAVDPVAIAPARNQKFVHEALQRRGDYLAAELSVTAEETMLERARRDLRPQVDLEVTVGYSGYDNRDSALRPLRSLGGDLTGPNALGVLSIEWPVANNLAKGALVSQRALTEQARLRAIRSANLTSSAVLNSLETLRSSIEQYHLITASVQTYAEAVEQTNIKMKAGEADFTEIIDVEDRYADARRARIDTLRRYAIALARLRLDTGSLSSLSDDRAVFNVDDILTVPFAP